MMRTIHAQAITDTVARLLADACIDLPDDVEQALRAALARETQPLPQSILEAVLENARIAREKRLPICQDTGVTNVFVDLGADVHVEGGSLVDAVHDGIRQGTRAGLLRNSIVNDPLRRVNTNDNAPGVVFVQPVPGDRVRIIVAPKGAGCENMSRSTMLRPADGREGIVEFVIETVARGGANPCPPVIVGVGLGGDFAASTVLAKRALLRTISTRHNDEVYADLEVELLEKINSLGLGPQALGGLATALDVFIEAAPCHIASLPVAVCLNCHATRHKEAEI
jgi:fumarate hydratase subunit alpha